jgi:ADP-ribose pyrophosphatase YjhB (NUDIX family)
MVRGAIHCCKRRKPDNAAIVVPRVRVAVCLTAAARLLVVTHRKSGGRHWLLPGGGVEAGETLHEAARREMLEETGLGVTVGRLVILCEAIEPGGRHLLNLVFAANLDGTAPGSEPPATHPRDPAILEARWASRDEVLALDLHPPIGPPLVEAWDAAFGGDVAYLGNVWTPAG